MTQPEPVIDVIAPDFAGESIDLTVINDAALNQLRIDVATEQERRYLLYSAPAQVAAIQRAEEDARGITPPADDEPWDASATYRRGARVTEDGISYTSLVSYNRAWKPSQTTGHAWVRDAPEPDEPGGIAPWAIGVAYEPGDRVTHDGQTWEAKISHTSHYDWRPGPATHAVWTFIA